MNILKSQWNPSYTINKYHLSSILTLLFNPNFDNHVYKKAWEFHLKNNNDEEYKKTIRLILETGDTVSSLKVKIFLMLLIILASNNILI